MAQIFVIGRVTTDPELKTSQNDQPYVRFGFAENIGSKDRARTQYYQVWAWREDAEWLVKAGVHKGSLLYLAGNLELETYTKKDGLTIDKRLRISLNDWGFVPVGNSKGSQNALQNNIPENDMVFSAPPIDGDKDNLPE